MSSQLLLRNEEFDACYQEWIMLYRKDSIGKMAYSYAEEVFGRGSNDAMYIAHPTGCCFIWFPDFCNKEEPEFVIDFFRDILKSNGYYRYLSDERNEPNADGKDCVIRRHYMKPEIRLQQFAEGKPHGQYGNIFLEVIFYQAEPQFIKITANYYTDRENYSFEKLMELLLGTN